MKRLILVLLLIICTCTQAQESSTKITVSFDGVKLIQALELIETKSRYRFYYLKQWVDNTLVSGNYEDEEALTVLENILRNTVINFYIHEDRDVFLTKNSQINDVLPKDFFGKKNNQTIVDSDLQNKAAPLFIYDRMPISRGKIETVRIGKENRESNRTNFTLSGKAINSKNGKPISDLAIFLKGKSTGTSTDSDGNYSVNLQIGENIIETRALGIQTVKKRFLIFNNGKYDFVLDESIELLDEVVVKGNRDRNIENVITGVTRVEMEGIKNIPMVLGESDILKAAIALPGISTAGEGATGYNVRGGRADQNLILLDNGVIYNPTHFFGIFSALNPFSTSTAEIYKGNIPAEFGGRISSVFDIKTKDGNIQKFSGQASIGPVTSNVVLETPIVKDKAALLIGARATYSDWVLRSLNSEQLKNSKASFFDIIGKYNHSINENNEIEATGYYSRDSFSITSDSLYDYSNRLFSLKWDHKFNEKNTIDIIVSNSEYQFGIGFDGESNDDFDLSYTNSETEFKLKLKYLYSDKHKFDYGISSKLYGIKPAEIKPKGIDSDITPLAIPNQKGLESAIFLSDDYEVNDKLLISAGLRYSVYMALGASEQRIYPENSPKNIGTQTGVIQFEKNETIETYGGPEARISARYFLSPGLSIKGSFNNAFQYIHTLSNNTTASPIDTWQLSNLNIKPQRANQFSLGLYKNLEGNTYELSLEGYYKKQKKLLDYKVGAQLLLNESIETEVLQGDGKAYGIELLVKKNIGKLNGWLSYTYSRSFVKLESEFSEEVVNNGDFFPSNYDKPHDLSLVTNYKFTKRFSASANFVYQTGRPVTFPIGGFEYNNSEFVYYSDRNKFRIPDYYRLDLSFNMEGNHKIKKFAHSFWSFSIYNILGRNNPYSAFFVTEDGSVKAFQSSIFSIPVPTITYNFKF
ncbi:MAG: carboxypeptidase-like regulatory domain-containing protein [Maribacter sp.]